MAELGIEVDEVDINRTPPPRDLLERHVDAGRLKDFLSARSPVFKTRPLPATKTEALDLMLAQPNLIRRPLLVVGKAAIFGFDRDRYEALREQKR